MAGAFDDLIPQGNPGEIKGAFDDLVPQTNPQALKGAFDDLVPAPVEPDRSFTGALLQGLGDPIRNTGTTLSVLGYQDAGDALKSVPKVENYESAANRFMNPQEEDFSVGGFAPGYLPRAIVEQGGQVLGSIGSRIAGAGIGGAGGGLVAGPGGAAAGATVGAFAGPFMYSAAQVVGDVAEKRARNNGRERPNRDDLAYAWTTAAASGALDSIGAQYLPGGKGAVGGYVQKLVRSIFGEGITEGLQSATEDVGGSINTEAGLSVSPRKAIGEAVIGAGAGGATQAGAIAADIGQQQYINKLEPKLNPQKAIGRAVLQAVDGAQFDPATAQVVAAQQLNPEQQVQQQDKPTQIQMPVPQPVVTIPQREPEEVKPVQEVEAPAAPVAVPTEAPATISPTPAPVAKQPAAPQAPEADRPANRRTISTASGTKIDADLELVPLSSLQQATGELQNRDRTRATSDDQIREIVAGFDPTRLGESAEADRGAPIVGDDNIIESGNGRVRAIDQVYSNRPDAAQSYLDYIKSLGLNPEGIDRPVLIRRRVTPFTPEQRRQFVLDANTESTMRLTASEQAKSDADLIDGSLLTNYQGGDVTGVQNANFVRGFMSKLPAASRSELIDSNGQLSQAGVRRIEAALMGRAYGNQELLSKLLEDRDNNIRSIGGAMMDVAAPFSTLRQAVADKAVKPEFDITKQLVEAARVLSSLRASGKNLREYLDQIGMFEQVDPIVERLLKSFVNTKMNKPVGRDKVAQFLRDYVQQAEKQTTGETLFELEPVTPEQLLDAALNRKAESENVPETGGLFDANKPPTEGAQDDTVATTEQEADGEDRREGEPGREIDLEQRDEVRRKKVVKSNKKPGPLNYQGRQLGQSLYTDAWAMAEDMGLLPKGTEPSLLPAPRQSQILRSVFKQMFGFRDIEIENNLNVREAIDAMLDGYASIQSMMALSGMPPSAISLNGTLSLKLLRNAGGALAYYSPGEKAIGMVRRNDSFAHEWGHALDWHMFFELGLTTDDGPQGRGLSGMIKKGQQSNNPAIQEAFSGLVDAMFGKEVDAAAKILELEKKIEVQLKLMEKLRQGQATEAKLKQIEAKKKFIEKLANQIATIKKVPKDKYQANTNYYLEARMLDKNGATEAADGGYWQRPTEMLARSFEAFMAMKMAMNDYAYEFATASDAQYQGGGIASGSQAEFFKKAYPQAAERYAIFAAWQNVLDVVRDQQLLGAVGKRADTDAVAVPAADILGVARLNQWTPGTPERSLNPYKAIVTNIQKAAKERKREAERKARESALTPRSSYPGFAGDLRGRLVDATTDGMAGWAYTIRGVILSLRAKYKYNAGLKQLEEWFATDPGSGKLQSQKFEEAVNQRQRQVSNRLGNIVQKHKLDDYTDEQLRELRELLIDGTGKAKATPEIMAAAKDLRTLLDDEYYYNQQNGVNIGYTKNGYLPRMVDELRLAEDPEGFRTKAAVVYREVFERDYGTAEDILGDDDMMAAFLQQASELIQKGDANRDLLDECRKTLNEIKRLERQLKTSADPDALEAAIAEATETLTDLMADLYPIVQDRFAEGAASDWYNRLAGLAPEPYFAFESRGPNGQYSKSRVLPEITDRIMGDFMITDPMELITTYLAASTRRVQFGKFFGNATSDKPLGHKLDDAFQSMRASGMDADDIKELQLSVDIMVGRYTTNMTRRGLNWRANLTAIYTPVMLARALWSQVGEPATIGIRSGDARDTARAFGNQLQDLLSVLKLGSKSAKEQAAWRREMSEFLGVTSHYMYDTIMANRDNLLFQSKAAERKLAKFYRYSFIHPHAMSMRRAAVATAFRHVNRMAVKAADGDKMAMTALREIGLDPSNEAMLDALVNMGEQPSLQDVAGSAYFEKISTAINRFVDEAIQEPKRADKPRMASQPEWSYIYGVLSFVSAFQRNVIIRGVKSIETAGRDGGKSAAAKAAIMTGVGFGTLAALQTAAYLLRTAAFGDLEDELEKWEKDPVYALSTIISRSGFSGLWDPIINVFQGVKYQRDLTSMTAGAIPGFALGAGQKVIEATVRNSANTNTAEYNAITGMWDLVVAPMIAHMVLSRAPIFTPALQITSAKRTKEGAAEAIVGPKEDKRGGQKDTGLGFGGGNGKGTNLGF